MTNSLLQLVKRTYDECGFESASAFKLALEEGDSGVSIPDRTVRDWMNMDSVTDRIQDRDPKIQRRCEEMIEEGYEAPVSEGREGKTTTEQTPDEYKEALKNQGSVVVEEDGAHLIVKSQKSQQYETPEDIAEAKGIDLTKYSIGSWNSKFWQQGQKGPNELPVLVDMASISVDFAPKSAEPIEFEPVKPVSIQTAPPKPEPVTRDADVKTAIVLADRQYGYRRNEHTGELHPIHDRRAIDVAKQIVQRVRPDVLIDAGDILDVAELSTKYLRKPELARTTQASICEAAWDNDHLYPYADDGFLVPGNHLGRRLETFLLSNAKAAYGLRSADDVKNGTAPALSIESLLDFDRHGIEVADDYPDGEVWLNDGCRVIHGNMAKKHPGQTAMSLAKQSHGYSTVQGHCHENAKASRSLFFRGERKIIYGATVGCLCSVTGDVPGVKKRMGWQQGLAVIHYDPEGTWHDIQLHEIEDGRCFYQGEWIEGQEPDLEQMTKETGINFQQPVLPDNMPSFA